MVMGKKGFSGRSICNGMLFRALFAKVQQNMSQGYHIKIQLLVSHNITTRISDSRSCACPSEVMRTKCSWVLLIFRCFYSLVRNNAESLFESLVTTSFASPYNCNRLKHYSNTRSIDW